MYSTKTLKERLYLTDTQVGCPVVDCITVVERQRGKFRTDSRFLCQQHRIYIGPSTFQYQDPEDALLLASSDERALLASIKLQKREDRMARERSEDALTWNVFRGLERTGRLSEWLGLLLGSVPAGAVAHYWSCESATGKSWSPLEEARRAFDEAPNRGSEPDFIIETPDADIWVEAKFGSGNDTTPSDIDGAEMRYSTGRKTWYQEVCKKDFRSLAVDAKRYELLRLWLLGSYAANQRGRRFLLVNLVREGEAKDIEAFADQSFRQSEERRVMRSTWQGIVRMLEREPGAEDRQVAQLLDYMRTRTLGYSAGRRVDAFAI